MKKNRRKQRKNGHSRAAKAQQQPRTQETAPLLKRLASSVAGKVVGGLIVTALMAYFAIGRPNIVEVDTGPPEAPQISPFQRVGDSLFELLTFSVTFTNRGLLPGRIDSVKPVLMGVPLSAVRVRVRDVDRTSIHWRQTRKVRVIYSARIPLSAFKRQGQYARWCVYFYDQSGNRVGWQGQDMTFGHGGIPANPRAPAQLMKDSVPEALLKCE